MATLYSAQYTKFNNIPREMVAGSDWGSKLRASFAKFTFTAAGQDTIKMIHLPAGKVRVLVDLSRVVCPQGVASADLHVGYAQYTKQDGTVVSASNNHFADNLDVGAAAIDQSLPSPAGGYSEFDSRDGVTVECMIDTANGPSSGDLILILIYQQGN